MKQKKSKLDQYAAQLAEMEAQKKTLPEMQAWLKEEGVTCAQSTLSDFLASQRSRLLQEKLLSQIASGARQCQEVEKQFGKNPAPELETLVKLHRVLVMQLSTQGNVEPELLKMADSMLRTAMDYASGKTKAAQKEIELAQSERKLKLLEEKAAMADSAKGVMENKELSEDQRASRMREIFGIKN